MSRTANEKVSKSRKLKTAMFMLLSMAVIIFLTGIQYGWFTTNNAYGIDLVSLAPHRIVAESNSWQLSDPKKNDRAPYLIYRGKGSPGKSITINGRIDFTFVDGNGKTVSDYSDSKATLVKDRHFLIGERRWYFTSDYDDEYFTKASLTVTWTENGKEHSEKLR